MKKFTCPYCYEDHTIKDCKLKCSYERIKKSEEDENGGENEVCINGVVKNENGEIPDDAKGKCLKCTEARKQFFCKMTDQEIPYGFLSHTSLPIALLGAPQTGKSHYIAVLINEIRDKMTARFNCSLDICCSEKSKKTYDIKYYTPLFKDGVIIEKTKTTEDVEPLIFPLRFMDSKNRIKNVATLTYYDPAGEFTNQDQADKIYKNMRYIYNSKGIILLLDPLQVQSIRDRLKGKMQLPAIHTDTAEILSRIIENIRNVKNITGKIKIPLALAFTKMDALEKFDILPPDSCLREESEHLKKGGFVISDFENTNIEMRDILDNWLNEEIVQLLKQFSNYAIFGLSALGDVPKDAYHVSDNGIHPKRVLDPLLWLLAENKYIKKIGRG